MGQLTNFLGSILRFIYQFLTDLGNEPEKISYYAISLMIMAVLIKIITMPLTLQSTKNMQKGAELQPEVDKIMKKYKDDPETQNRKMMELYKENDYKPGGGCGGCLVMLIPLIIIWAMLGVIRNPDAYLDLQQGVEISKNFLWIPDLSKADPNMFGLPFIYAISMFGFTYLTQNKQAMPNQTPEMQKSTQMMQYMMPILFFFMGRNWASGIMLYWTTSNIIEIIVRLISKLFIKPKEA